MTFEDYRKNLKGVNGEGDFSPEFLVGHDRDFIAFAHSLRISKISMIPSGSGKLLCLKNTLVN